MNFSISNYEFDLLIIGAGGAGLTSAISAFDSGTKNLAVISKVLPTSSHTVSAKGGINASLGNVDLDDWRWHAFDTIKGSDYLADYDAVELMCKKAGEAILFLEQNGVVFSRDPQGKIAQRAYGGQTTDFGEGKLAFRACYSKDKTGHSILHTLHQQALKREIRFFNEFFVLDLITNQTSSQNLQCLGCIALDCNSGEIVVFRSKALILATGGYSQIYRNTTSSLICTGDGTALALRAGFTVQDMEFVQFHPTGIFGKGFLITEAVRGEGAYLLNKNHERFMANYAPKLMELASRDVISLAMAEEIAKGRAVKDEFLYLDMRHLSDEVLKNKLPGVVELVKNFARLDVKRDLIPVSPSAHYSMGGVPCDLNCQTHAQKANSSDLNLNSDLNSAADSQLYCIGEAACLSVHGANRLGCNSLLDLIVFGRIAGENISRKFYEISQKKLSSNQDFQDSNQIFIKLVNEKLANFAEIFAHQEQASRTNLANQKDLAAIKEEMQKNNDENLGVIRSANSIECSLNCLENLFAMLSKHRLSSTNLIWNEELIAYLELQNLLLNSLAVAFSAKHRFESRGAHFRSDFVNRNDQDFLAHSQIWFEDYKKKNSSLKISDRFKFKLVPTRNSSFITALQAPLKLRQY